MQLLDLLHCHTVLFKTPPYFIDTIYLKSEIHTLHPQVDRHSIKLKSGINVYTVTPEGSIKNCASGVHTFPHN